MIPEDKRFWAAMGKDFDNESLLVALSSIIRKLDASLEKFGVRQCLGWKKTEGGPEAIVVLGCGPRGIVEARATIEPSKGKSDATVKFIPWSEVTELVQEFHPELRVATLRLRDGAFFELVRGPKERCIAIRDLKAGLKSELEGDFAFFVDEIARILQAKQT